MSMTRNEILIALADGKDLEVKGLSGQWTQCSRQDARATFDELVQWLNGQIAAGMEYRIKRTPREWWMNVYADVPMARAHRSKDDADCRSGPGRSECVHVREVLE